MKWETAPNPNGKTPHTGKRVGKTFRVQMGKTAPRRVGFGKNVQCLHVIRPLVKNVSKDVQKKMLFEVATRAKQSKLQTDETVGQPSDLYSRALTFY